MADLDEALRVERAIDAAYMRGYRASRRSDLHVECRAEAEKFKEQIQRLTNEIEILKRLIREK